MDHVERPSYCRFWGKTSEDGSYHLLPYHCLDVAAVGDVWWERDPVIRRLFVESIGEEESTCLAWVRFFLALHDLGKLDIRFQLKATEVLGHLRPGFDLDLVEPEGDYYHGPAGWAWFVEDSAELGIGESELIRWGEWGQAVCGHHGSLSLASPLTLPMADESVVDFDQSARLALLHDLAELFLAPVGRSLQTVPPPAPDLIAGFCAVCDWIGSNQNHFRPVPESVLLHDYWKHTARKCAIAALDESGAFASALVQGGMAALYPDYQSRQVQTLVDRIPVAPGLTLIEAPTGSGKTEAALAYASRLLAAGLADSVIFALPTQATANAMFERLQAVASVLFPSGSNLLLAHGMARYNDAFSRLKDSLIATAQDGEEAFAQCVHWLAASRKRAFLGQVGVCTIDQVFLSVLPVRHQFVRAFGVRKSVLIIDEVHAYDAYMYGLLERVVTGQRVAGASAILLSATLPSWQKRILLDGDDSVLQEHEPYPKITHAPHQGAVKSLVPSAVHQPMPYRVDVERWHSADLLPGEVQRAAIIAAASRGALVGIVCNLVADAQQLAATLRAEAEAAGDAIPVDLFHARYRFKDRQMKERTVMARYGKEAARTQGRVLVATQVIEQSLDLDFDWLITQLSPIDLLFQRIGRLHRHPRARRPTGFTEPLVTALLPEDGDYRLHQRIYGHRQVLWRSQQLLERNDTIAFPAAYRDWIEQVYAAKPWPDEPSEISSEAEQYREKCDGAYYGAKVISVTGGQPLPDTDGAAARLTRDGEMNLTVIPVQAGRRRTLLDGEDLDTLDEGEQEEAIDMNAVGVPAGWRGWLPEADEGGRVWLEMTANGSDSWYWTSGKQKVAYHPESGLVLHREARGSESDSRQLLNKEE